MDTLQLVDTMEEELIDVLGKECLFDELSRALSYDEKQSCYEFIARMHDVSFTFEDDNEE